MKCTKCNIEMESVPSTIKVGKTIIGNSTVKIWKCPRCKWIHVERED